MIDIGSTKFLVDVPSLPPNEFETYSTSLFDEWERVVERTLILPDYSISLEIEEGSIKGKGKIAVALGALYIGIGTYGDFISGLKTISEQVSYVSDSLIDNVRTPFDCKNANVKKSGGQLSRLRRLFENVQQGLITIDEAMKEATNLLGDNIIDAPGFVDELRVQLEKAPRHPVQLALSDESWDECSPISSSETTSPSRKTRQKPLPPSIPQRYRIEIWRDSKKDKKKIKVSTL
jgi:hypothetical protein